MSAPPVPTIPDDVLLQLLAWVRDYLELKRDQPNSEPRTLSLNLWTGFQLALTELRSLRQREFIEWHEVADELPDPGTTVLIYCLEGDEPVWLGWYGSDGWYELGGCHIEDVVRWARLPRRDCESLTAEERKILARLSWKAPT